MSADTQATHTFETRAGSADSSALVSIVIPAHDEAAHIADLLTALTPLSGRAEVVVVANGCSDDTAAIARRTAAWATVVELDVGSKPLALSCGDEAVTAFPRLYLDADVTISADDVVAMVAALDDSELSAVAPTPVHDLEHSSRVVRSHYRIWLEMTTNTRGLAGANPQMLSESARKRFDRWPRLIGDDYFLGGLFAHDEVRRLNSVTAVRQAPLGVWDCMSRKARIHAGNVAVADSGVREHHDGGGGREALRVVREHPARLVDLPAHLLITLGSRLIYHWRRRRGRERVFFRDRSRTA